MKQMIIRQKDSAGGLSHSRKLEQATPTAGVLQADQFESGPLHSRSAADHQKLKALRSQTLLARWAPPSSGDSKELGKEVVERLKEREFQATDNYDGPQINTELNQAFLAHQFPLEYFGNIAFHGFLSTAETVSDKMMGHEARLLKPQKMVGLELDLSNETHRKLVPKYAFTVLPERPADDGFPDSTDYPLSYGEATAVLRQDVLERSTWSYGDSLSFRAAGGPRSKAHSFEEDSLRKDLVNSCSFLEAQIWGELGLEDVEHFVLSEYVPAKMQESREDLESGKYQDSKYDSYRESLHKKVEGYDRFLKLCEALKIPVYAGELSTRLTNSETKPASSISKTLVKGLPSGERPEFDRSLLSQILGPADSQLGSERFIRSEVFTPGLSAAEQAEEFANFQSLAQQELWGDD